MTAIEPPLRRYLVREFTRLRDELAGQVREGGPTAPDPANAARELSIYESLLAGLTSRKPLPEDDENVREYVAEMLRASDRETDYESVVLRHDARRAP